jgi:hypothetical protein
MIPDDDDFIRALTILQITMVNSNNTLRLEETEQARRVPGTPERAASNMSTHAPEAERHEASGVVS